REQLGDASIEIQAYTQALKKVEAQLVAHQQNQLWYEEKIRFMKIDLDDKTDVLTYHKKLLAEDEKEKEELKAKMSARDKAGLWSSDIEDSHVNDRYAVGMHAVPPLMTRIYIPSRPDVEIDELQFTYGPKQYKPSESNARSSDFNSCESNSSKETLKSMPEPVVNEPKVVSQPKVSSDAPIIEEYESDSDDDCATTTSKEHEQPSFAFVNTAKHVKTPKQTVKEQNICSQSPKPDKKDCSGLMSKKLGLGYGFTKGLLTRTGKIQVNTARASSTNNVNIVRASSTKNVSTARHNFNSQAVPTNAARKVNIVKPIDYPQRALKNKGIVDSGCSRHMTGNKAHLAEYQDYNGGPVAF
ncbi:hypothetical protein Tco_0920831, partial [Tanacetum coccineum]